MTFFLRQRKPAALASPPPASRVLQSTLSQTEDAQSETDGVDTDSKATPATSAILLEAEKPWSARAQSFKTRAVWTLVLIFSFFAIIAAGHFYCSVLVVALMGAIFYEITTLKRNYEKEHKLPLFFALRWYWFAVTNFFFIRVFLATQLQRLGGKYHAVEFVLKYHSLISYGLLCFGLVVFVLSLRRFTLRYQFQQLSWALVTLLVCVMQGAAHVANIYNGLVWFLLPTLLVIANDIFAYIFGFCFGRTPLIKLSPKKTWEGFIGGTVSTMVIAILLCEVMERSAYFMCPQSDINLHPFRFNEVDCPEFVVSVTSGEFIGASALKLHALVLGTFASLVAPFGGFFASGFKRAFKIKDFGASIPGHGGITDRFDCQIIMGMFTYIYFNTFVAGSPTGLGGLYAQPSGLTVDSVIQFANSLSEDDRAELVNAILFGGGN